MVLILALAAQVWVVGNESQSRSMLLVASGRKSKRQREGQPVRSAVACEFDAEKAVQYTEAGCCIMFDDPGTFLLH